MAAMLSDIDNNVIRPKKRRSSSILKTQQSQFQNSEQIDAASELTATKYARRVSWAEKPLVKLFQTVETDAILSNSYNMVDETSLAMSICSTEVKESDRINTYVSSDEKNVAASSLMSMCTDVTCNIQGVLKENINYDTGKDTVAASEEDNDVTSNFMEKLRQVPCATDKLTAINATDVDNPVAMVLAGFGSNFVMDCSLEDKSVNLNALYKSISSTNCSLPAAKQMIHENSWQNMHNISNVSNKNPFVGASLPRTPCIGTNKPVDLVLLQERDIENVKPQVVPAEESMELVDELPPSVSVKSPIKVVPVNIENVKPQVVRAEESMEIVEEPPSASVKSPIKITPKITLADVVFQQERDVENMKPQFARAEESTKLVDEPASLKCPIKVAPKITPADVVFQQEHNTENMKPQVARAEKSTKLVDKPVSNPLKVARIKNSTTKSVAQSPYEDLDYVLKQNEILKVKIEEIKRKCAMAKKELAEIAKEEAN